MRREIFIEFFRSRHTDNQTVAIDQAIVHVAQVVNQLIKFVVEVGEQIF